MSSKDGARTGLALTEWRKSRYSPGDRAAACLQAVVAEEGPDGEIRVGRVILRPATRPGTPTSPLPEDIDQETPATEAPEPAVEAWRGDADTGRFLADAPASVPAQPQGTPVPFDETSGPSTSGMSNDAENDQETQDKIRAPQSRTAYPDEWLEHNSDVPAAAMSMERFHPAEMRPAASATLSEAEAREDILRLVTDGRVTLIRANVRDVVTEDGREIREFTIARPVLLDGVTPQELADFNARAQALLDQHINFKPEHRLPRSQKQLHVWVALQPFEKHTEGIHLTSSIESERASQLHLDIHDDDSVLVHEFMHYLGVEHISDNPLMTKPYTPAGMIGLTESDLARIEDVSNAGPVIPEGPDRTVASVDDGVGSQEKEVGHWHVLPDSVLRVAADDGVGPRHPVSQAPVPKWAGESTAPANPGPNDGRYYELLDSVGRHVYRLPPIEPGGLVHQAFVARDYTRMFDLKHMGCARDLQRRLGEIANVRVSVANGLSDQQISAFLTPRQRQEYPEILAYLNRANKRQYYDQNLDISRWVNANLNVGGTHFTIKYDPTASHDLVIQNITRATTWIQTMGYGVPNLTLYLPKYTRSLEISLSETFSSTEALNISEGDTIEAQYFSPNSILFTSALNVAPDIYRNANPDTSFTAADNFEEREVGLIIHEFGHAIADAQNPYHDLDLFNVVLRDPSVRRQFRKVSRYAAEGFSLREFIAEWFTTKLFGATAPGEEIYRDLGGPVATGPENYFAPIPLDSERLEYLTRAVNRVLPAPVPADVVRQVHDSQLATFERRLVLIGRAQLIAGKIRSSQVPPPALPPGRSAGFGAGGSSSFQGSFQRYPGQSGGYAPPQGHGRSYAYPGYTGPSGTEFTQGPSSTPYNPAASSSSGSATQFSATPWWADPRNPDARPTGTGGPGQQFPPGRPYGFARVEDPVASRLAPGATIVVRPNAEAYATRHDGEPRALTVRPDAVVGSSAGGAAEYAFVRRFEVESSSASPWVSYRVEVNDDGTAIVLPDETVVPGEGWYRHGPLFLHPGEQASAAESGGPGFVMFADTGWIGRIDGDNTTELFTGLSAPDLFNPGAAARYRITAGATGMYLVPQDGGQAIHLPWQETIPAPGPVTHPAAGESTTRRGWDADPARGTAGAPPRPEDPAGAGSASDDRPVREAPGQTGPRRVAALRADVRGGTATGAVRAAASAGRTVPRAFLDEEPRTAPEVVREPLPAPESPLFDDVIESDEETVVDADEPPGETPFFDDAFDSDEETVVDAEEPPVEAVSGDGAGSDVATAPMGAADPERGEPVVPQVGELGEVVAADAGTVVVPGFGLGGVPTGVGWSQARWAQSWGLQFVPHRPLAGGGGDGSAYAAVLAAFLGAVTVGEEEVTDVGQLRQALGRMMRAAPSAVFEQAPWVAAYREAVIARAERLPEAQRPSPEQIEAQVGHGETRKQQMTSAVLDPGHWPELDQRIAGLVLAEYLGVGLLLPPGADGRPGFHGARSPQVVLAQVAGADGVPSWVAARPGAAGPAFGGLSGAQVGWAADAGMAFLGRWDGAGGSVPGDLFAAVVAAARAEGLRPPVQVPLDDPRRLRDGLARWLRAGTGLTGPDDWAPIVEEYEQARRQVPQAGGPAAAGSQAAPRGDAEVRQEIIAGVWGAGGDDPYRRIPLNRVLPQLASRYLGVSVTVLDAGGQARSFGEGPGVTVAAVAADGPGSWSRWAGLGPVPAPRVSGAGTRPAGVAGGWTEPGPVGEPAGGTAGAPVEAPGPDGLTTAQRKWARRHPRRPVPVSAGDAPGRRFTGLDGLLDAVLVAAGGGFAVDDEFVRDAAHLRRVLVEMVDRHAGSDEGRWLVIATIFKALYPDWVRTRHPGRPPAGPYEADQIIDSGRLAGFVRQAVADPGFWPELAQETAPYLLNWAGLAVRVIDPAGVAGRYGRGRPIYVAAVGGGTEPRGWVPLVPRVPQHPATSPLNAPDLSDPVLVRLAQALHAHTASAGTGTGANADAISDRLRATRRRWLAVAGPAAPATAADMPEAPVGGPAWLTPQRLIERAEALTGPAASPQASDETVGFGLALSSAVALLTESLPQGIDSAPAGPQDQRPARARGLEGVPADLWVRASLADLQAAVPSGGRALFLGQTRVRAVFDTTGGLWQADFDEPGAPPVIAPSPEPTAAGQAGDGSALVIDADGRIVPADRLGELFTPASEASGSERPPAADAEAGHPLGVSAGDRPAPASAAQETWATDHQAALGELRHGVNAFYDAVIEAAGGELALAGPGVPVTDALDLRRAAADRLRAIVSDFPAGMWDWPRLHAEYGKANGIRIAEEHRGRTPDTPEERRGIHAQTREHIDSGTALDYAAAGIERPGHWEEINDPLAPFLVAALTNRRLLVVDADARVHEYASQHDDPAGPPLVVARTGAETTAVPGWAAVVPEETGVFEGGTAPFADVLPDGTATLTPYSQAGTPATLTRAQDQTAAAEGLHLEPTLPGPDSFYSAVLTAAGGGILLDPHTFITDPAHLRRTLKTLVLDRPDLVDETIQRQIHEIAETEGAEPSEVIDTIIDHADSADQEHLIPLVSAYLDLEVRVIGTSGAISSHGAGQPITIAPHDPTVGQDGPQWAALVPDIQPIPPVSPTLPGLPDLSRLPDLDGRLIPRPWDPDHYRNLEPGSAEKETSWRESSHCTTEFCVSVTVVYL